MGRGGHSHHGHSHHGHSHHIHDNHSHGVKISESRCGILKKEQLPFFIMLSMTLFFFLVELIAGQITKSLALTTDSFHMLADSLAHAIGLASIIVFIFF
jgi:cobalt-zinc-cadmium efflux system protein